MTEQVSLTGWCEASDEKLFFFKHRLGPISSPRPRGTLPGPSQPSWLSHVSYESISRSSLICSLRPDIPHLSFSRGHFDECEKKNMLEERCEGNKNEETLFENEISTFRSCFLLGKNPLHKSVLLFGGRARSHRLAHCCVLLSVP